MKSNLLTAPLNKLPRGLLDFFGIQSFGENPLKLGDAIQPNIDLFKWYVETNIPFVRVPPPVVLGAASVNGGTVEFPNAPDSASTTIWQVPQTECWLVNEFVVKAVYAVGADLGEFWPATYDFVPGTGSTRPQPSSTSSTFAGTAAFQRVGWASMNRPFFAAPGTVLCAYSSGYTSAGALTIEAHLKYLRLRV